MAHITHPRNRGAEHIFGRGLCLSGSTSPAVDRYQHEEKRHGIQEENGGRTSGGYYQSADRRSEAA